MLSTEDSIKDIILNCYLLKIAFRTLYQMLATEDSIQMS